MYPVKVTGNQVDVGTQIPSVVKPPMSRVQIAKYAGASGDFNPLHVDEMYATQKAKMKSVIAHGMLSMGFLGHLLTEWVGSPLPVRSLDVRFQNSVYPGDVITLSGQVTAKREEGDLAVLTCQVQAANQDGVVVTSGVAEVALPGEA